MTRGVPPPNETIPVPDANDVLSAVADLRTIGDAICKVTNNTDKALDATLQLALGDDPALTDPYEGGEATNTGEYTVSGAISTTAGIAKATIAASGSAYFRVRGPWAYARIKGEPAEAPADGGTLAVVWSYKHRGD